ncbi:MULTISPECIES: hypothetical protein [unclassified Nostoc]|uniref:hypothetical protein n=1 Tax=unclassified Nostoc TaxID=2593658 RepID=UPI00260E7BD0|nr:hypothetical protein [Nostoc sp. S13]MDF5735565.1 hypothetical protein [Nostoc sp. S13]
MKILDQIGLPSFLKVVPIINSSNMGAIALIICCQGITRLLCRIAEEVFGDE